jgi:hypothetical protein
MTPWWKSAAAEFLPGWLKSRRMPKPGPTMVRDVSADPAPGRPGPDDAAPEHRPEPGVERANSPTRSEG